MKARTVCYVTSEIAPFAKAGGLADVSAALPVHLHEAGLDVRVFAPLYSVIDVEAHDFVPVEEVQDVTVRLGSRTIPFSLYRTTAPESSLHLYFVHCPMLYDRPTIYTSDEDEHLRFLLLSHASLVSCQRMQWAPDILHCHDWQTALLPLLLKTTYAWDRLFSGTRSILTIHNLGYQGVFSSERIPETGLDSTSARYLDGDDVRAGHFGFLKTGIRYADLITTVSPTYAEEIQTEVHGAGLDELLRERSGQVVGILNGIDTTVWNPIADPNLPVRYSAKSVWRKEKVKEALLEEIGLPYSEGVPLVGMITRLVSQKGIDLLMEPLPDLLERRDFQLVILASGEARFEAFFEELQGEHPDHVHFHRGFHAELAHRIEGGSDLFLMPSIYEPCGLNQMYSLVYGTVPIVRKTGGLADTVQLWDPRDGTGNGIVFEHPTKEGIRWALESAFDLYASEEDWRKIQANGMSADFSWEAPGKAYRELYDRVLASAEVS